MFVSEILLAYLNNTSHIHSIEKTSNMYFIDIQCIYYIYVIILYTNIYIYIYMYTIIKIRIILIILLLSIIT